MTQTLQTLARLTHIPEFSPEAIGALMNRLEVGEKAFALLMNVTPMTVRLWTSGAVKPSGVSSRLMQVYENCPEIVDRIAAQAEPQNDL